ncbi:MAG: hypothetical protein ABR575_07755, partial [Actinomycetota bacterium]
MSKRMWAIFLSGALVAGVFAALPASAAPEVPATPNVTDLTQDANGGIPASDTPTANVSDAADVVAAWFSHDAEKISVHIQTLLPPPSGRAAFAYNVYGSPNEDFPAPQGCLRFITVVPSANANGGTYQGQQFAKLVDRCNDGTSVYANGVEGEAVVEALGDGTGLVTMTFPRSYSPLLADGAVISGPTAWTHVWIGTDQGSPTAASRMVDDTKPGTDYTITAGGPDPQPTASPTPPGKDDPPGKKKGCKKGGSKAKKKGCKKGKKPKKPKKPKPPAGCAAYVPGEAGADAETTKVTDAATAEAPVEVELDTGPGVGSGRSGPLA